jgi:hypothetical protein
VYKGNSKNMVAHQETERRGTGHEVARHSDPESIYYWSTPIVQGAQLGLPCPRYEGAFGHDESLFP